MDDIHVWIGQQVAVIAVRPVDAEGVGVAASSLRRRAGDGDDLGERHAPDRIDVRGADEPDPDDPNLESLHARYPHLRTMNLNPDAVRMPPTAGISC